MVGIESVISLHFPFFSSIIFLILSFFSNISRKSREGEASLLFCSTELSATDLFRALEIFDESLTFSFFQDSSKFLIESVRLEISILLL